MRYGSVCSGIEAATVAWHPLGWSPAFLSEIEPAPRATLKFHYPDVPLHGDFTTIQEGEYEPIDLLVGGTPCQSFSVAGLRGGLEDDRGNLALEFLKLAQRLRPRWIVWENVPGVLSSISHAAPDPSPPPPPLDLGCDGAEMETEDEYESEELHAFNCFLAGISELGYGWAYRVLDAQHFGVPQRRRRVFVVGYLGDWRRAAAVLLERHSLSGNPPPRREAGQGVAAPTAPSLTASGCGVERTGESRGQDPVIPDGDDGLPLSGMRGDELGDVVADVRMVQPRAFGGNNQSGPIDISTALNSHGGPHGRLDFESETFITHALRGEGFDASEDGTGRGTPLGPVAYRVSCTDGAWATGDRTDALTTQTDPSATVIAFSSKDHGGVAAVDMSPTLRSMGHDKSHANAGGQIAVAMNLRGRDGGAMAEMAEMAEMASLRAASGGSSRSYVAFDTTQITSKANRCNPQEGDPCHPLAAGAHPPAVAYALGSHCGAADGDQTNRSHKTGGPVGSNISEELAYSLRSGRQQSVATSAVRRLTPPECERLQGFPPGYTDVPYRGKPMADGPRYKELGNSMAVPVMAWIGRQIVAVEAMFPVGA